MQQHGANNYFAYLKFYNAPKKYKIRITTLFLFHFLFFFLHSKHFLHRTGYNGLIVQILLQLLQSWFAADTNICVSSWAAQCQCVCVCVCARSVVFRQHEINQEFLNVHHDRQVTWTIIKTTEYSTRKIKTTFSKNRERENEIENLEKNF